MPSFAEKLSELREAAGLSQAVLAKKAGLSQKAVSNWEQGERLPSWDAVLKICRALDVSCTEFEDCDAGPPPKKPRGRPKRD